MATLADAYSSWRAQPFPSGSTNDVLDEIHADLVLVDLWVAGAVIPFIEHGQYRPPREVDVLGGIDTIRERATVAARSATDHDRQLAVAYKTYADLLDTVYRAWRAECGTPDS